MVDSNDLVQGSTGRIQIMPAIILGFATFFYWVALYLYLPVFPGYVRELGASATWIGVITGSYGVAQVLLRVPLGVWADRLGLYKPFVLAGCVLALVSALVLIMAQGPSGLLAGRTLAGMAATCWLAFMVLYGSYFPQAASLAVIIMSTIVNMSTLVGQSAGPYIASFLGIRWIFYISAALGLAATVLVLFAPEQRQLSEKRFPSVAELLRVCTNQTLVLISLLAAIAAYLQLAGASTFVNYWAQQHLSATSVQLGILALFYGVPAVVATLFAGIWLVPRTGTRFIVVTGFFVSALTIAVVPELADIQTLYWTQAISGVASGLLIPPLISFVLVLVPAGRSAAALGFFQSTLAIGMILGPIITGFIADSVGLSKGFLVMGVLALVGSVIALWLLPANALDNSSSRGEGVNHDDETAN